VGLRGLCAGVSWFGLLCFPAECLYALSWEAQQTEPVYGIRGGTNQCIHVVLFISSIICHMSRQRLQQHRFKDPHLTCFRSGSDTRQDLKLYFCILKFSLNAYVNVISVYCVIKHLQPVAMDRVRWLGVGVCFF
jgi:hypothetical protein